MHSFQDTEDRTWTLAMTIGAVKRVRAGRKVNLLDPLSGARLPKQSGRKPRPPLLSRIQMDIELLVDVIWLIVQPEAKQHGVSDVQFAEALGGDAAYHAYQAFMQEWRSFFQRLHRETEAEAIEANLKLAVEDDQRRAAMVPRVTKAAVASVEMAREEAIREIEAQTEAVAEAPGPSETATDSPESSESIPMD